MPRIAPPPFSVPRNSRRLLYALVRPWGRWAFELWHRVERPVPGAEYLGSYDGKPRPARLLFSGHQNGLADPVLACITLDPQLHFFTRADVFRKRVARWCVLHLNMMPVFRTIDRVRDLAERNRATFEAAHARLEQGATCGIFPEAGHLDERRIRRFKHGSARFIAGALQHPAIVERGLELLPLHLDFERYEGYRTRAGVTVGPPVPYADIPGLAKDAGHARIVLGERMREALIRCSIQLNAGPTYDAHLAVCRFLEGHAGGRGDRGAIARVGRRLEADAEEAMQDFDAALAAGMAHPRSSEIWTAAGRIHAGRETRILPQLWRLPFWLVFVASAGWWPRIIERWSARSIDKVAFRTTLSIPANMLAVLSTWVLLSVAVSLWFGTILAGLALLVALRISQALAMPLVDALIDRSEEDKARFFLDAIFLKKWCHTSLPTQD